MWKDENGPYMQALYFAFGIGSLIGPLICLPFLSDQDPDQTTNFNASQRLTFNNSIPQSPNITQDSMDYYYSWMKRSFGNEHAFAKSYLLSVIQSQDNNSSNGTDVIIDTNSTSNLVNEDIVYPFFISGGVLFVSGSVMLLFYFVGKYDAQDYQQKNQSNENDKKMVNRFDAEAQEVSSLHSIKAIILNEKPISTFFKITLISIGATMLMFYEGVEALFFDYIAAFSTETKLRLSDQQGAYIALGLSCSYTIGRGLGIVAAMKIRPRYVVYFDLFIISCSLTTLYIYANDSAIMLFISVVTIGLGFSTFSPSIYSYLEEHLHLTNFICGILLVSCSTINIVDPVLAGYFLQSDAYILIYLSIGSIIIVIFSYFLIEITAFIKDHNIVICH